MTNMADADHGAWTGLYRGTGCTIAVQTGKGRSLGTNNHTE